MIALSAILLVVLVWLVWFRQKPTPVFARVATLGYVESLAKLGIKWYCNEATRSFCPNNGVNREIGGYVIGSLLNYQ